MNINESNRQRISADLTFQGILFTLSFLLVLLSFANNILHKQYNTTTAAHVLGLLVIAILLRTISRLPKVEYDTTEKSLYLVANNNSSTQQVPLSKVDKILYSMLSLSNRKRSYVIVYRDERNLPKKLRVFVNSFDSIIDTIMNDAKKVNPHITIRNWSNGFHEFFD